MDDVQCILDKARVQRMQLDLNLLTALDALLEEGGVTAAAQRLHLSPPAMSRALGRIRRATGDEILVRTGRTMTPTPRALALRGDVHALVQQAHAVLAPQGQLDLATLRRTFTLRCHDSITSAMGPDLLTAVHTLAPGVQLRLLAEADTDTEDLRHGRTDLEIGGGPLAQPEIRSESLGQADLVLAVRPDHPSIGPDLTVEQFAAAQHITISRRGRLQDPIDDALAARGLHRQVIAAAPTSTVALQLVRHSDVVVAVPAQTCALTLRSLDLRTLPIPLELPPVRVSQAWHQRYDNDPAHAWLRDQTRRALRNSLTAPGPA